MANIGTILKRGVQSLYPTDALKNSLQGISSGFTGLSTVKKPTSKAATVTGSAAQSMVKNAVKTPAQTAAASRIQSPSVAASTAGSGGTITPSTTPAPSPTKAPAGDGYTSSDALVQARIKQMQSDAENSSATLRSAPNAKTNAPVQEVETPATTGNDYNIASLLKGGVDNSAIEAARQRLLSLYTPSDEEAAYQDELTTFQENARLGEVALEGQGRGIPLALVRGQQGKLNEQAAIGEQTIIQRLAAAQAQRQAEQQAASQELGYAQQDYNTQVQQSQFAQNLALQQANQANTLQSQMLNAGYIPAPVGYKAADATGQTYTIGGQTYVKAPTGPASPVTLGEGQQLVDPSTGSVIAQNLRSEDPIAQQKGMLEIQRLQQQLVGGNPTEQLMAQLELQKIQQDMESEVTAKTDATESAQQILENKKTLIESLLGTPDANGNYSGGEGMGGAVGTGAPGRISIWGINKGKVQNFVAGVEQLTSQETMQTLADLKARGATLGALSDKELQLLYSAASKIGSWRKEDAKGNIYYAANEQDFINELTKLLTLTQKGLQEPLNQSVDPATFTADDILYLQSQGIDPTVFTKDLSRSQNGSIGSLSERFESGGNPGAVGYDTAGGLSYGTYQLAHNNAKTFVEKSQFKKFFEGLAFNSQQFVNKWKEVAQAMPEEFAKAQKSFIAATHYIPQMQKLAEAGLAGMVQNPVLKDVIWSTAVQHGPATNLIISALKALPADATDADKIKAIYTARWNGGRSFASSTPQVRQSVFNRFFGPEGELQMALKRLTA